MNWAEHLQVIGRLTGHWHFTFLHGIEIYLYKEDGIPNLLWLNYVDGKFQNNRRHIDSLNPWLSSHVGLELISHDNN